MSWVWSADLDQECGLQKIADRQQAVVEVQLRLHFVGVGKPGDADHFLHAEPECLAILENERELRADAHAAITVDVAAMSVEVFLPLRRVLFQRQQIIHR